MVEEGTHTAQAGQTASASSLAEAKVEAERTDTQATGDKADGKSQIAPS